MRCRSYYRRSMRCRSYCRRSMRSTQYHISHWVVLVADWEVHLALRLCSSRLDLIQTAPHTGWLYGRAEQVRLFASACTYRAFPTRPAEPAAVASSETSIRFSSFNNF